MVVVGFCSEFASSELLLINLNLKSRWTIIRQRGALGMDLRRGMATVPLSHQKRQRLPSKRECRRVAQPIQLRISREKVARLFLLMPLLVQMLLILARKVNFKSKARGLSEYRQRMIKMLATQACKTNTWPGLLATSHRLQRINSVHKRTKVRWWSAQVRKTR